MDMQLIIKAPNQNIEDLLINCQTDWTVLKLKKHLSEVYPNKPGIREQKLIYSGRLLHDHLQLKDVFRHENSKSVQRAVYTIHLVCSGDCNFCSHEQNSDGNHILPNEPPSVEQSDRLPNTSADSSSSSDTTIESLENVLRYRGHSSALAANIQTQFPQTPISTFPVYPTDPQMLAQMAAMQQMYAQYVTQYWQSVNVAATSGIAPVFPIANFQPLPNNPNNTPAEASPAQQPANQRLNAVAEQANEDNNDFANRDWLDQLFVYCRFLVLLSIVYFYSTPERFMLVILCMVIAFLYREGWFMRRTLAEAVMRHRIQHGMAPEPPNNANERASNQDEVQDGHELEAAMDGEDPPHAQNPDVVNNNQVFSPLAFLVMFFSSLIPEPPPPVNIN